MRMIAPYGLAALVLAGLAAVCAAGATLERQIADAQADLAVVNLTAADRGYAAAWERIEASRWLSELLAGTRMEIAAKQAAIRYWRADYATLLNDYARNTDSEVRANIPLRLTVANAAYRSGQFEEATAANMLNGLDQALGLYDQLLQDANGSADVAFNYEFLVRLRDALGDGTDWEPRSSESPLGQEGGQPLDSETELDDVEIYVPMYRDDRDLIDEPTMGGDPPIRRRG